MFYTNNKTFAFQRKKVVKVKNCKLIKIIKLIKILINK